MVGVFQERASIITFMNIYFGLGSNLGDRLENLNGAIEKLKSLGKLTGISSFIETAPWGGVEQPNFLNACAKIEAKKNYSPLEILRAVKNFEIQLGRVESVRWGPRKIDIDILLIDDLIFHSPLLDVPHIRIPERLFVLVPLEEILPAGWRHPENNQSIREMIKALKENY